MSELLSCPFCGKSVHAFNYQPFNGSCVSVVCDWTKGGCGATGGFRDSEDFAIAAWNTRAPRPESGDVERLVDELINTSFNGGIEFHKDGDSGVFVFISDAKAKLLSLLSAPQSVTPNEKNLIGAIRNAKDNEFICQSCGANHDLGKYRVVKDEPVTPEAGKWISVKDRMPETEVKVIAFYVNEHGKHRRIMAMYAPRFTLETDIDDADEADEYNEEHDKYYLREGWYERNEWDDCHWKVDAEITHWMPLPEPPAFTPLESPK